MKKIIIYIFIFSALTFTAIPSFGVVHKISASGTIFSPSSITNIQIGDTIRWEWESGTHTTTSTSVPSGANTWDNPLSSSSSLFEYKVLVEGIYNYKCTPHESVGMIGSFVVGTATDISNDIISNINSIQIYPNPFMESIWISYSDDIKHNITTEISSLNGEVIFIGTQIPLISSDGIYLNLSHLTSGIYFLKIFIDKKSLMVKKIIKY